MNEGIRIQFEMDGQPLPVDMLDATGLRFEDEVDTWPRTLVIEFDGDNEITRTRMKWVRERMGWNPGLFSLEVTRDGGDLLLTGVDERAFPGGVYWLVLQINGLTVKGGVKRVVVDDDRETTLRLVVAEDPRRVVLRTPIAEWDDLIRALLGRLRALAALPARSFYDEGPPASPDHLRLLARAEAPGDTLQSFRQDGRNSMQVVVAYPGGEAADARYFADVDIDLGNPLRDLEGFVIHMGELLSGSDTDHLKLHDALTSPKQRTAPFIYYDVRRG